MLVLLDFSAAFDTVDHNILLKRLENWVGLSGMVHKCFRSYLEGRVYYESIGEHNCAFTPQAARASKWPEVIHFQCGDSKSSVLILLDLSTAFDTINHQILLSTLSSPDITGIPLRWFESHWSVFQGGLGREGIQSTSIGHWGSPGLDS